MGILQIIMSVVSGGATGLLGVLLQRYFDYKKEQTSLELLKINNAHAEVMEDKRLVAQKAEWDARASIATTQATAEVHVADRDLAAREVEAAATLQEESYKADKATYFTGAVLKSKSRFVLWAMAFVDAVRGLVRPVLTGYLVYVAHAMYGDLQALVAAHGDKLTASEAKDMLVMVMNTLLYLATTATVWWFGTRPPAQPRK